MRIKIILNPQADNGRAHAYIKQLKSFGGQYEGLDLVVTKEQGHGEILAREAVAAGYDLIVAAGGDGTVHEVVNGLMQGERSEAHLGIIPIGSGNDLAFALGIPMDMETAVKALYSGTPTPIDLIQVNGDNGRVAFADNNIGIGFDAAVVIQTEQINRLYGFLMYLWATILTILYSFDTPQVELQFDEETITQPMLFMALGNGFRGGGGFLLTPDARLDDNLIDSCLVDPVNRFTMLSMLVKAMRGTHITKPFVTMRKNQQITLKSDIPLPIHVDGEMFAYPKDNVRQVTMNSLPAAIKVVV